MKKPKAADKKKEKYVTPPEGFEVPDIEDGETFEVLMEITKKKDGLCISSWDGIEVEDDGDEAKEAEEEVETIGAGAKRAMKGGY